jgi:hypothetical protein
MKNKFLTMVLILLAGGTVFSANEKTFSLGAVDFYNDHLEAVQVSLAGGLRPKPVLTLSSERGISPSHDMLFSFDEVLATHFKDKTGRYELKEASGIANTVLSARDELSYAGSGAAVFAREGLRSESVLVISPASEDALFLPNNVIQNFEIDFYVCPVTIDTGAELVNWRAASPLLSKKGASVLNFSIQKGRLELQCKNFFVSPDRMSALDFTLRPTQTISAQKWSRHTLRFDSETGLLEYLVNGSVEDLRYTTVSGREGQGKDVYLPVAGENGAFILGRGFNGILDELCVKTQRPEEAARGKGAVDRENVGLSSGARFREEGGWLQTKAFDLGREASEVLRVNISGGRTNLDALGFENIYAGNDIKNNFADNAEIDLYIRTSNEPLAFNDKPWQSFTPGESLAGLGFNGRYVELRAAFFPSNDGRKVPYIEEVSVVYKTVEPPLPPTLVTAIAGDSYVDLSWRAVMDSSVSGYTVFYGESSGVYLGASEVSSGENYSNSVAASSPVDAGEATAFRIEGLENGVLYYFAVAAYSNEEKNRQGNFSREVRARPRSKLR